MKCSEGERKKVSGECLRDGEVREGEAEYTKKCTVKARSAGEWGAAGLNKKVR